MKTKFIYLPKEILKNSNLRPSAKLLAFHLFHLCGWNENPTIDNISTISKELSVDRKTVREDLSVLQDLDIIKIYEDNTFKFFINSVEFDNKKDLSNKEICNMFGDFFKIPTYLLYVDIATPTMREAAIMFFEFNFDVDRSGFSVKHEKVCMESVSTYYHINYETFKKRVQKCKEVGLFEYTIVPNGDKKLIIGAKTIEWERKWVRKDGNKVDYKKIEKINKEPEPEKEAGAEVITPAYSIEDWTKDIKIWKARKENQTNLYIEARLAEVVEDGYKYFDEKIVDKILEEILGDM